MGKEEIEKCIKEIIHNVSEINRSKQKGEERLKIADEIQWVLRDTYHVDEKHLSLLYHPSMIDIYPHQRDARLGSPRIDSIRNPMAMRSLFQMRHVINRLLKEGKIDCNTEIHIELARELNDANRRVAIQKWNNANEKRHNESRTTIIKLYKEATGREIAPTDEEVLKYELWEEQKHICLYTGKTIGIADFIGSNPKYDIEHTIPRSVGGDSTNMNLTLCDSTFNREVKGTKIPTQLSNHTEIIARIKHWKEQWDELERKLRKLRTTSGMTKAQKDKIIQQRHYLTIQRDYWRGKYERFTMMEVPEGFSLRQGVDINVISKYALAYLKSVFNNVYTRKGVTTAEFRRLWGLQELYVSKDRTNHIHHCIDAVVVACIGQDEYTQMAQYYRKEEEYRWDNKPKPHFTKPWDTFVEDVKGLSEETLISHNTPDNVRKKMRRRIRVNGKKVLCTSDVVRGPLHKETYYGAIQQEGEIKYVVRKPLSTIETIKDIQSIVDPIVRDIVQRVFNQGWKEALKGTVWMNEEKKIPITKVRCYATDVKNPLHIRQHRDLSDKKYKQQYHVKNDENYCMAIYIGEDTKGKGKRDFELISLMDVYQNDLHTLISPTNTKGYKLAYVLKKGTMVLLYDDNRDAVFDLPKKEQTKRLYKVIGLSSMVIAKKYLYGTILLKYHQEARMSTELKARSGEFHQDENTRPIISMLHTQFKALVEGYDFTINEIGEIKRLR